MKRRIEPQGVHFFDRQSGDHILFDEVITTKDEYSLAPRTVSIAITDKCDFECAYCYVDLKNNFLDKKYIFQYCHELDNLGTFEIALGGGEPTLHPDFTEICNYIWDNTKLGISLTTHGHHISEEVVSAIKGKISFIRISIDGIEPIYSKLRGHSLDDLLKKIDIIKGVIPFGFNTVINKMTLKNLDGLKELFLRSGANEWLILPMWNKGKFTLSTEEWRDLNHWLNRNWQSLPLRVSSSALSYLEVPILFTDTFERDYGFIGVDRTFRSDSFTRGGLKIDDYPSLKDLFQQRYL